MSNKQPRDILQRQSTEHQQEDSFAMMDDLLPQLLAFPAWPAPQIPLSDSSYDDGIKAQVAAMRKISEKSLLQQASGGESPLNVINPALNTVPYTFILIAYIHAFNKNGNKVIKLEALWEKISTFLETFDARQIRYLGQEFMTVVDAAVNLSSSAGQRALCIAPLRDAVLRLEPDGSVLTPIHLFLVKLALETRAYEAVSPLIKKFVLYFPNSKEQPKPKYICELGLSAAAYITVSSGLTSKMKPLDIMEYFLLSGMVFIGLRRWDDALDYLESAITYPAKDGAVSKVMVEAYKKWVLVSVLLEGKPLPLPKTTSSAAAKAYHVIAKPYEAVAQIFETGTASRLKAEVDHGHGVWEQDRNVGLIFQILIEYQRFQIRNLGKVYNKISIPEVLNLTMSAQTGAKLSGPTEMEALVQSMIQDGSLNATMSKSPGQLAVLTFDTHGPVLTETQMNVQFAEASERVQAITQHINVTDRMLTHEKDYVTYAKKQKASASKFNNQDQGIAGDMDWNALEEEELMSGVF